MSEVTKVPVERFPCGCVGIRVSEERKVERQSRYEYKGCTTWIFYACDRHDETGTIDSCIRESAWCPERGELPRRLTVEEFERVQRAVMLAGLDQARYREMRCCLQLVNPQLPSLYME